MIVTISPAKNQNFEPLALDIDTTHPRFQAESDTLFQLLSSYTVSQLAKLMSINADLAQLTYERVHQALSGEALTKPAIFAYDGAVYRAFAPLSLSPQQLHYAESHLCILSGMYGVLSPLDAIHPYRLEMAHKLPNEMGKNLYNFWTERMTAYFGELLSKDDRVWVNLASQEYSRSLPLKLLPKGVVCITPQFKQLRPNGEYKTIVMPAKMARGAMARYVIEHELQDVDDLKAFDLDGYHYMPNLSTATDWVFVR